MSLRACACRTLVLKTFGFTKCQFQRREVFVAKGLAHELVEGHGTAASGVVSHDSPAGISVNASIDTEYEKQ